MIEIAEPLLTQEEICDLIRRYCHAEEEWINLIDFASMPSPCLATTAAHTVLLAWSFLERHDRPFIFPCRSCVVFVPHSHDDTTGCGPSLVFLSGWPPGRGAPRDRIPGVSYHFGNPN